MIRLKPPQSCGKSPRGDSRQSLLHRTQSTSLSRQVSWKDRCHGDHEVSKRPMNGIIHYGDNGFPEKPASAVCRHSSIDLHDPRNLDPKRTLNAGAGCSGYFPTNNLSRINCNVYILLGGFT